MNTAKRPAVSVLLPTYNQARFLPECLDALDAQTFGDFELLAFNDGSTDGTLDILRARCPSRTFYRSIHSPTNFGTAHAINCAADMARGQLLTWVSSDNVMFPDWLETLVGAMTPDVGAVYSDYIREESIEPDESGNGFSSSELIEPGPYAPDRLISSESCYFGPSFLIRREVWQEHRGGTAHDLGNWLRVEEACWDAGLAIKYVDKVLCTYRVHPDQTAKRRPDLYDAQQQLKEARERRHAAGRVHAPAAAAR